MVKVMNVCKKPEILPDSEWSFVWAQARLKIMCSLDPTDIPLTWMLCLIPVQHYRHWSNMVNIQSSMPQCHVFVHGACSRRYWCGWTHIYFEWFSVVGLKNGAVLWIIHSVSCLHQYIIGASIQETQLIGCGRHAIEACHENMQAHVQYKYGYAASWNQGKW